MIENNQPIKLDLETLILIAGGHTAFQLLWAGIELELYEYLSQHPNATKETIAEQLTLEMQPARILLTGLTALGIVIKEDNLYSNADLTEAMLVASKPGSAAKILGWQRYIVYEGLTDFVKSLKENTNTGLSAFPGSGNTLYQRLENTPFKEHVFQDAMSALSKQANFHLLNFPELEKINHLVDAGGGNGTNGMMLCQKYANMTVSIFDSESVCNLASTNIAQQGMSDRVKTWAGNFLKDPFPENIDAVLYSHIMTIWSPQTNLALLQRTYDALPSDGKVIIFNMMGNDDDTGPLSTALGSPYFQAIASGDGMLYSWTDYESWMIEAGFKVKRYEKMPLSHGILIGTK